MPTVELDEVDLYYERRGEGPALLLIAGLPATAKDWRPFAERLADSFTVVSFDNRGSGRSDKPESYYSIEGFADDAANLIEELGIEAPHVFGFSMGGMIAQELAIRHGDSISRLVLGCTDPGGERAVQPAEEVAEGFTYEGDDWGHRVRLLAPHAFAPDFRESNPEAYEAFVEAKTEDVQPLYAYRRQLGAAVRHDAYDRLGEIDNPTLVITGTEDAAVPPENSEFLHQEIPDSRLEYVPDAGHLFFIEKPEETAAILKSFLLEEAAPPS